MGKALPTGGVEISPRMMGANIVALPITLLTMNMGTLRLRCPSRPVAATMNMGHGESTNNPRTWRRRFQLLAVSRKRHPGAPEPLVRALGPVVASAPESAKLEIVEGACVF